MKYTGVIFDLDGTLCDTLADIADSANVSLDKLGFPTIPEEEYKNMVGDGLHSLLLRILPKEHQDEETILRMTETYSSEYASRWNDKSKPYPGITEMLATLLENGVLLAILSNKPERFTQLCADALMPEGTFHTVMGHRDDFPRKPAPDGAIMIAERWNIPTDRIIYVGDTATDMKTGLGAGMFTVGVKWGFRPESELLEAGANAIISHPQELITLMEL